MMLNSGLNSGKMRGGRRQVLQLGDDDTTALARKGKMMHVGSSSKTKPAGLSALGEYSDSDTDNSDGENHNGTATNNGENDEGVITSSIVPDNNIDSEVGSFLNEVNHLSASNSPAREGSSTPPTCTQSNQNKPKTKISMYKSMFVKGATEWNRKDDSRTAPTESDINELPEEPTTDWQICIDENTQYQYYWNTVNNEVTWTIPSDYTQYLLQYKMYEEQLAKIPDDRREYLQKKKLGLIQSPKIIKPKPSPPKQERQETLAFSTPVTVTNNLIGQSVNNGGDPPMKEELTDSEKQFYSEIKELEKMDVEPPEEKPPLPEELPPLPPMPPPPEVEMVKSNGDHSVTENEKPENKASDSEVNIDLEDIDNALEKALETKKEELKKLEAEETVKPQPRQLNQHHNKHKRHSSPDSSIQTSQVAKKRKETVMVEEISRSTPPPSPPVEKPSKQAVESVRKVLVDYEHEETDDEQQGSLPSKKNPFDVDDVSDIEDIKDVLESKLEFINTTKKGVTRLQLLLIQLQTRYSDYLHGALKKEYFHQRLSKLQTELQEYEKSATPEGWTCQWDRNSRSYFYTDDINGDTQWEHPDSAVQVMSESPHHHRHRHHHHSSQSKSRSSKSHSSKRSKDKRRDEKKYKSKSSRRSDRDKDKERDRSESPEIIHKSSRNHRKVDLDSIVENISLGGLLSKNREAKTESITIEDDDDDEDVPASTASSNQPSVHSDTLPTKTEVSNAYNAATSDEDEEVVESHEPSPENSSTKPRVVTPFGVIAKPTQYNSSEVSTSSMVDASLTVNSLAANSYAVGPSTSSLVSSSTLFTSAPPPPPPPPQESNEVEGEPTVSSSEIKNEEPQASTSKESKKKKKEKDMHNTNFSLKKKKVSSLVNKWKKVKIEVEKEEKIEDERQLAIRQKLEEWKKDQP